MAPSLTEKRGYLLGTVGPLPPMIDKLLHSVMSVNLSQLETTIKQFTILSGRL